MSYPVYKFEDNICSHPENKIQLTSISFLRNTPLKTVCPNFYKLQCATQNEFRNTPTQRVWPMPTSSESYNSVMEAIEKSRHTKLQIKGKSKRQKKGNQRLIIRTARQWRAHLALGVRRGTSDLRSAGRPRKPPKRS
jgi:hypothetical protein